MHRRSRRSPSWTTPGQLGLDARDRPPACRGRAGRARAAGARAVMISSTSSGMSGSKTCDDVLGDLVRLELLVELRRRTQLGDRLVHRDAAHLRGPRRDDPLPADAALQDARAPPASCAAARVASWRMPGTVTPWNRTGVNSMIRPVQLISQPTTPVKTGMESEVPASRRAGRTSRSPAASAHRPPASASSGPSLTLTAGRPRVTGRAGRHDRARSQRRSRNGLIGPADGAPAGWAAARAGRPAAASSAACELGGPLAQLGVAGAERGDLVLELEDPA